MAAFKSLCLRSLPCAVPTRLPSRKTQGADPLAVPPGCRIIHHGLNFPIAVLADWHSSCVPVLLKDEYKPKGQFSKAKVALCIHNIAFQVCSSEAVRQYTIRLAVRQTWTDSILGQVWGHLAGVLSTAVPSLLFCHVPHLTALNKFITAAVRALDSLDSFTAPWLGW